MKLTVLCALLLTFTLPAFAAMPGMTMTQPVESEFAFLAGMVPHHEDALGDARLAAERSNRPEIRELAQNIVAAQDAEIAQIEGWLSTWYPERDRAEAAQAVESMAMPELENLSGDAFDRAFLEGMTAHHQMAVQMAASLLEQDLAEHDEVRTLAENIRKTQNAEINQMRGWLETLFAQAPADARHGGH